MSEVAEQTRDDEYLAISSVAEVVFCPRNFYYRVVEGAEDENEHTLTGRLQEEKRSARRRRSRDGTIATRSVHVAHDGLRISGIIDVMEEDGELVPVEFKKGQLIESLHDDVQLCAYAMAAEEAFGRPVTHGYVVYVESKARRPVWFTDELREAVEDAVARARSIIASGAIPEPVNDARCRGCALVQRCQPAEVALMRGRATTAGRPTPSSHYGRVLVIDQPGAYVRKDGERLKVTVEGTTVREVPLASVDEVVLVGRGNLSTAAAEALLTAQVPVHIVTTGGRYRGRIQPAFARNVVVRLGQARAYYDEETRLEVARAIVGAKLHNMRTLARRYERSRQAKALSGELVRIRAIESRVGAAGSRDELLGLEGMGSRLYFQCLGRLAFAGFGFSFDGRNRRPPRDPVNALLSFLYSLLTAAAVTAVETAGLDPYIGLYHEARYGRPALALDLVEEFRAVVADSVALELIARGAIKPHMFENSGVAVLLTDEGRRKVYEGFLHRMQEDITHPALGYRTSYRRMLEFQARLLGKRLTGDVPAYLPLRVR